jgi:hypothetical protein
MAASMPSIESRAGPALVYFAFKAIQSRPTPTRGSFLALKRRTHSPAAHACSGGCGAIASYNLGIGGANRWISQGRPHW